MTLLMSAEPTVHRYEAEQGYILYEILGGAQLTKETNLNIQGRSELRFKEWGAVMQEEDTGILMTAGAIDFLQEVKRLEQHMHNKIISVDYENEQLLERKKSNDKQSEEETKGLIHRGQDVVAGILCAVWIGPSIKKCIYKGVVLKQESHVLGVSYMKKAVQAVFDSNISKEHYTLPDYPIQKFSLFTENATTKAKPKSANICKVFKDVVHEVDASDKSFESEKNIDKKKREKFINKITEGIFKKQKEILPKLLSSMKKSRECIQLSEDLFERNICVSEFNFSKKSLGFQDTDYDIFIQKDDKNRLLDVVEDAIISLEPRISCVRRSQNFIDLSTCMK